MAYQLEGYDGDSPSRLLRPGDNNGGIGHWLRRLLARHSARVMLHRLLRKRRVEGIEELPAHLLRDIGLPHDCRSQGGVAHFHPPV